MKKYLIIFLLLFLKFQSFSQQNNGLETSFDVNFKNVSIETVLNALEKKSKVLFAYNPLIFNGINKINYTAKGKSTRQILTEIVGESISFKTKGNYVILHKKGISDPKDFTLDGYVFDLDSKEKLALVSIYEPISLVSTISNTNGYYKIKLRRNLDEISLRFSREDYLRKKMVVPFRTDGRLNIGLTEKPIASNQILLEPLKNIPIKLDSVPTIKPDTLLEIREIATEIDSLKPSRESTSFNENLRNKKERFLDWLMNTRDKIHARNIRDSINRSFQLSFLPFLSTNGRLSAVVSNDFSLSAISGISKNVNKADIGGVLNLVMDDMTGFQAAGVANIVGNNQKGFQSAGITNIVFGSSKGFVSSGITNIVFGSSKGFLNSGITNIVVGRSEGVHAAGIVNIANDFKGVQLSGVVNLVADSLKGVQVGLVNITNKMNKSVQIGMVNIAYQATNSLPIGFFSYVHRNGYRRLELSVNDIRMPELSFKTGVQKFYNIFSIIHNTHVKSLPSFGIGYGVGISQKITRSLSTDFNVSLSQFFPFEKYDFENWGNQYFNMSLALELKLTKFLAVFAAPTFNMYSTNDANFDIADFKLKNYKTSTNEWFENNPNLYHWLGFKAGIRLCNIR